MLRKSKLFLRENLTEVIKSLLLLAVLVVLRLPHGLNQISRIWRQKMRTFDMKYLSIKQVISTISTST